MKLIQRTVKTRNDLDDYKPKYLDYTYDDYVEHNVMFLEPMNAKEVTDEFEQEQLFNDENFIVEDKLDGTRALVHFMYDEIDKEDTTRVFSRRVSVKTNWLSENTDSLPQFSLMKIPELRGTVIDGELRMPEYGFKEVSSTLNCTYDKAIQRQRELNFICLYTFDILYYKGEDVTKQPLWKRKELLEDAISIIDKHYPNGPIKLLPYYAKKIVPITITPYFMKQVQENFDSLCAKYPRLMNTLSHYSLTTGITLDVPRECYYDYVVANGGEGVMIKPIDAEYECGARKRAFLKVKKFLTRECVLITFNQPTEEYKGKFPTPEKWRYWKNDDGTYFDTENKREYIYVRDTLNKCKPISKYFYENWVGNIIAGVLITPEEIEKLPKKCKDDIVVVNGQRFYIVAEVSGFDEETRAYFTEHKQEVLGSVIEIKANEIFRDTGRLRHPRYLRLRPDKSVSQCTFENHILS